MDDFRVGSLPPIDPYGHRQPSGAGARKRQKDSSQQQEDPAPEEPVEDYYTPSDPNSDS